MQIYNYLTRKKEEFLPIDPPQVKLYTCGPTVYDHVHIGNWRTFIFEDILKRVLKFNGYKVLHVMNLTDIDDKIIKKTQSENLTIDEVTQKYKDAFFEDLKQLNIERASNYPGAIENIDEMIKLVTNLIDKGYAYEKDGSVYFSISKFKNYGELSGTNVKGVKAGARVNVDEYGKDNPQDFVLWKASDERAKQRHEAFDSPWGIGRPGWHIECSAMSMKYLGESIDIHAGGVDLLFPHHENEIAQSEAATGKKFVNYWVEGEHLLVNGEKMAKSLGNIFTLQDVVNRGFDPLALRYLFLTAHYRSKMNFTWESLEAAKNALNNIKSQMLEAESSNENSKVLEKFKESVCDDLDMPKAIAIFHEALKAGSKKEILELDNVLGLGLSNLKRPDLPEGAQELIVRREEERRSGNFAESDKLRVELARMGVEVEDTTEGPKVKVKNND